MRDVKTAAEAMALLEALIKVAKGTFAATARPISFVFPCEEWSFDPSRTGAYLAPFPCSKSVLSVHTTPEVLGRLLTAKEFYLKPGERLRFEGDGTALEPLSTAIRALTARSPR